MHPLKPRTVNGITNQTYSIGEAGLTPTPNNKATEASAETAATLSHILESLDDLKGLDVRTINVTQVSDVTDFMILASGTSNRHVRSLVNRVTEDLKESGVSPLGVEGRETSEWVLVDYGDIVVHVMQAEARSFYDLERLWGDLPNETDQ